VECGNDPIDLGLLEALAAWVPRRIHVHMNRVRLVEFLDFPTLLPDEGYRGRFGSCLNGLIDE
jgi:hypothetical protein